MLKGLLSAVLTTALYVSECVRHYPHVKLFPVTNKKNVPIFRKTIGVVSLHWLFVFVWTVPMHSKSKSHHAACVYMYYFRPDV